MKMKIKKVGKEKEMLMKEVKEKLLEEVIKERKKVVWMVKKIKKMGL